MSPTAQFQGPPPGWSAHSSTTPGQALPPPPGDPVAAPEVYVNLKPYLLPFDGRLNVHALFAPGFLLLDADGQPVLLNEHGLTVKPLPPGSQYTTDGSQAAAPPAYDDVPAAPTDSGATPGGSAEVRQRLERLVQLGVLPAFDEGLYARLQDVPEAEAVRALDEAAAQDMTKVRNPAAYIVGMLRGRGPGKPLGVHAAAPELLERLETMVRTGLLEQHDPDLWERLAAIPLEEAMLLLDEVDVTDFSHIRNRAAYIIGMIRTRERVVAGVGFVEHSEWPADWICPACGMDNFTRRTECFRCAAPAPHLVAVEVEEPADDP
eukprot:EG_transcript_19688